MTDEVILTYTPSEEMEKLIHQLIVDIYTTGNGFVEVSEDAGIKRVKGFIKCEAISCEPSIFGFSETPSTFFGRGEVQDSPKESYDLTYAEFLETEWPGIKKETKGSMLELAIKSTHW